MKKLLAVLLLTVPAAAGDNPGSLDYFYNVRYSDAIFIKDGAIAYVIWNDADDWEGPSKEICEGDGYIRRVIGGSLSGYLKADGNVVTAGERDQVSQFRCD